MVCAAVGVRPRGKEQKGAGRCAPCDGPLYSRGGGRGTRIFLKGSPTSQEHLARRMLFLKAFGKANEPFDWTEVLGGAAGPEVRYISPLRIQGYLVLYLLLLSVLYFFLHMYILI